MDSVYRNSNVTDRILWNKNSMKKKRSKQQFGVWFVGWGFFSLKSSKLSISQMLIHFFSYFI